MVKNSFKDIGILGGSFDPPHKGHLYVSKQSLKRLKLKKVIWAITKKNPLKKKPFFSFTMRKKMCQRIIKGNKKINKLFNNNLKLAKELDWKTEYLDAKISVKSVKDVKEAVEHVIKYGTMHTDCIISNNKKNTSFFLNNVNSSIAMHNVSTQFADGGEFGFGGEIGISTNKLPPRGPVGLNQLTSYKYIVKGKNVTRP